MGASLAKARKKILCIEDDGKIAAQIIRELVNRGFDVSVAQNGSERLNEITPQLGHVPFVFLAASADREHELKGRRLGADDYVTKPIDFDLLTTIINARLAGVARTRVWPTLAKLNDREIAALTWVARGKTSAEIARKLRLTKRTVDFHIDNARNKLGVVTRSQAVAKAASDQLITP